MIDLKMLLYQILQMNQLTLQLIQHYYYLIIHFGVVAFLHLVLMFQPQAAQITLLAVQIEMVMYLVAIQI